MKTKLTFTSILLLFAALAFAAVKDLAGNWAGNVDTPNGQIAVSYIFKVDGQKLTGKLTGPEGMLDIENGMYKDSLLSFDINGIGDAVVHQTGKFYGDSVVLNFTVMDNPIHLKLLKSN